MCKVSETYLKTLEAPNVIVTQTCEADREVAEPTLDAEVARDRACARRDRDRIERLKRASVHRQLVVIPLGEVFDLGQHKI